MMRLVSIVTVAVCAALASGPGSAGAPPMAVPVVLARPAERMTFTLGPGQTKVDLGRGFIVPGTDSVTVDGAPLARESGYRINTLRGSLVLVTPAAGGERLVVRFVRYPFAFSPVFAARVAGGAPGEEEIAPLLAPAARAEARRPAETYQLRLSGSKSVGVNVGTGRDLGLDQSLRVTMVGKVAKDLEVNAYLSDDNLPVQPEGNTEELKYLDKVYVQVKAKHTEVQLGDFTSSLSWSPFSSYQRELRGILANVSAKGASFFAGGGVAKGRFKTVRLTGREGVQGPYELLPARRFNTVVILSGTERVYFDGRPLKRGSENDYTIDYNRGTVTFTERVGVTDDSEIVIDYEMSEDNFERTTVTGGWTSPRLGGAVTVRAFLFQESDDPDRPVSGALTDADRKLLAAAGDDSSKTFASGIARVEDGAGDYDLVPADSLPAHFVYVGTTGGDYRLTFYDAGSGKGDYVVDGFTATGSIKYRFAGAGKGDFRIGRFLPVPERTRLFSLGVSAAKGIAFLEAEGDASTHDRNTLSSLGDGDNGGTAAKVTGGIKDLAVPAGRLTLSGEISTLDARFVSPDKPRESYFYRDWGLEGIALSGRETIGGARLGLAGARAWSVQGSYLALSRDSLSARKAEGSASVGDAETRGLVLRGFDSNAGSDRERRFLQGSGAFAVWHLVPRLALETERYRSFGLSAPDTGRYYRQGALSVAGREIGPYRGALSFTRRLTDGVDSTGTGWFRTRESDEIGIDGGFSRGSTIVELTATHRETREELFDMTNRYNLARLRARDAWTKAGLAADVSYRLSSGEERTQERAVIFVGKNQGDYDQLGREVGQRRGDYQLVYLPGGDREPVRTVELSTQVSVGAGVRGLGAEQGGAGFLERLWRGVALDHSFSVLEKSKTGDLVGLYLLRPSLLQRNDVTVYGVNRLREELTLFNASKVFKLRVSYAREDEEDNRIEQAFVETFTRDVRVRVESAPREAFAVTWEGAAGLRRHDATGLAEPSYRVETGSLSQTLTYRLGHSTRISLALEGERRTDRVSQAKQTSYTGTPSATSAVSDKVNLSTSLAFTYTDVRSSGGQPLFFLEQGLREDWNAIVQYRVSRNVSFGLNYTGRHEKDFLGEVRTVHDLKMESRAYF